MNYFTTSLRTLFTLLALITVFTGCDSFDPSEDTHGPGPMNPGPGPMNSGPGPMNPGPGNQAGHKYVAESAFSFEFPADQYDQLRLENVNGEIKFQSSTGAWISITGQRRVASTSQADAEAYLEELQVRVLDLADGLTVRSEQPASTQDREYAVDYTITLPESFDIAVAQKNGDVTLSGFYRDTGVDLVNGDIKVTLPPSISAVISAKVNNGKIRTSGIVLDDHANEENVLESTLGNGEAQIDLRTVNGDIEITGQQ